MRTTEETVTWLIFFKKISARLSPTTLLVAFFRKLANYVKKTTVALSSPISSVRAIEIKAILFLFMMNCYKSSFQECITIIVLKIDPTRNQPPYCLLQLQEKKALRPPTPPRRVVLGLPSPSPRVCTDGRTYADVRTKIFRINGLPNLLTYGAP